MGTRSWTLADASLDRYVEELSIGPDDVPGAPAGWQVTKRRLYGGLRDGVDVVEIDTGALRATVLPTRGMGLWRLEAGGLALGWQSPAGGPVHPKFVRLYEPAGLGWLAGFGELLCRCGLESNGAPVFDDQGRLVYPLHGKIANTPAHTVTVTVDTDAGEITVTGVVDEARLFHPKLRLTSTVRCRIGASTIEIDDDVANRSAEPGELELLYHINFGPPLLDAGAKVVLPLRKLAPFGARAAEGVDTWDTYAAETAGFTEQVYFCDLLGDDEDRTRALLRNAHGNLGVSLHFNRRQLPSFTLWKSTQMAADGYVTGLEPGTGFSNPRPFEAEHGRVVQLTPGEKRRFQIRIEPHANAADVAAAEEAIARLQAGSEPEIHRQPIPQWSPEA